MAACAGETVDLLAWKPHKVVMTKIGFFSLSLPISFVSKMHETSTFAVAGLLAFALTCLCHEHYVAFAHPPGPR